METYILIIGCYGLGCYLSYRQGRRKGMRDGMKFAIEQWAKSIGTAPAILANRLLKQQQAKHGNLLK